jgi:hypothetical protein
VFSKYVGENWGDGTALRFLMGTNAPQDQTTNELFAKYERNAATPSAARAVLEWSVVADCRPIRETITVPTLVVAHSDDLIVPIQLMRETAAGIPGARLVELSSPGHWSWDIAEQADLDVIEEFLTGAPVEQRADRVLATVLYTDIVGSTELAFRLGDRRWRHLLDNHDRVTRRELRRFGGREVNTTGDGFVAVFDGPARAVECAQAIVREAQSIEVGVRAGCTPVSAKREVPTWPVSRCTSARAWRRSPDRARCSCRARSATWSSDRTSRSNHAASRS